MRTKDRNFQVRVVYAVTWADADESVRVKSFQAPLTPLPSTPIMSSSIPINTSNQTAPTPQNTPFNRDAPIHSTLAVPPAIPDIAEAVEEVEASQQSAAAAKAQAAGALSGIIKTEAGRNVLTEIVQGRLHDLVGKSSGYIESLPLEQKRTLAALQGIQGKQGDLMKQFRNEIYDLEKKVRLG